MRVKYFLKNEEVRGMLPLGQFPCRGRVGVVFLAPQKNKKIP
jgi:hypothetical protein